MRQDLLHAFRSFRRTPAFTIAALVVLALGIGANTAIFSVVNAVLLRPLPYKDQSRLAQLWMRIPNLSADAMPVTQADFADFRQQNRTCVEVAGYSEKQFNLAGSGSTERVKGARVTWTLFPLLGVSPEFGRIFTEQEDRPGPGKLAVLGNGLWQRRFGGAKDILSKTILLDSQQYTIIGVMPREFEFPLKGGDGAVELWIPAAFTPEELAARGDSFDTHLIARLKPGVSVQQAAEDADRIARWIHATYYPPNVQKLFELRGTATSLEDDVFGKIRASMWILLSAVGLVLLIGCANVANLLLARSAARRREVAIRTALGAARGRLIRQMLTESVLLAGAGGVLGCVLAYWGLYALVALAPGNIPRIAETRLDAVVLAFTAGLSLVTGMLFGLTPAWASAKVDVNTALKAGGRGASSRRSPLRAALVVAEVALSLVLLVAAGLLMKSFVNVQHVNPGVEREHVLTFSTALPIARYSKSADVMRFYGSMLERLAALPGVTSAGGGTSLSLDNPFTIMFTPESQTSRQWGRTLARNVVVDGDYFRALGIRLLSGRVLGAVDTENSTAVVMINETMAKRFWRDRNPVGQRLRWGSPEGKAPWLTIVGVVADVKNDGLDKETVPGIYMPASQIGVRATNMMRTIRFAVRSQGDAAGLAASVRRELAAVDPELPVYEARTLSDLIETSTGPRRFPMLLLGLFAILAIILAAVGLYGVMSYTVSQYTQEIGVRMALGASPGNVQSMVVRQGMRWAAFGLGAGLVAAAGVTRWLDSLLFGVGARDPWVFGGVAAMLMFVTLAACWIPARRATRVDPLIALRQE